MLTEESDVHHRLPRGLVVSVVLACIVPLLAWGFVGEHMAVSTTDGILVHSLLEWSAVCASLFTALFVSRLIFDFFLSRRQKIEKLSI